MFISAHSPAAFFRSQVEAAVLTAASLSAAISKRASAELGWLMNAMDSMAKSR